MYNIKTVRVVSEASINYQKFCCEFVAEVEDEEDLASLRQVANQEAFKGVMELSKEVNTVKTEQPKVQTTVQKPAYTAPRPVQQAQKQYTAPRSTVQQNSQQEVRMASEAQLSYLRSFGYTGPENITFADADYKLKVYKGEI